VGAGDGAAAPSHVFEEVPPSPVTKIAPGPMGTLIAGFANGVVGLWKVDDGTMLDRIRVHGPITHLMIVGDRLHAASELGDHAELDLSVFHRSRCEVLRLVWAAVPVVWSAGAAEMAPPPRHDCEP